MDVKNINLSNEGAEILAQAVMILYKSVKERKMKEVLENLKDVKQNGK